MGIAEDEKRLAEQFNQIAYSIFQNQQEAIKFLSDPRVDLEDKSRSEEEDIQEPINRILCHHFYYALYHDYLSKDSSLACKTTPNRHEEILLKLEKMTNDDGKEWLQIFSKLQRLRVWADYGLKSQPPSKNNFKQIAYKVYRRLASK